MFVLKKIYFYPHFNKVGAVNNRKWTKALLFEENLSSNKKIGLVSNKIFI